MRKDMSGKHFCRERKRFIMSVVKISLDLLVIGNDEFVLRKIETKNLGDSLDFPKI